MHASPAQHWVFLTDSQRTENSLLEIYVRNGFKCFICQFVRMFLWCRAINEMRSSERKRYAWGLHSFALRLWQCHKLLSSAGRNARHQHNVELLVITRAAAKKQYFQKGYQLISASGYFSKIVAEAEFNCLQRVFLRESRRAKVT